MKRTLSLVFGLVFLILGLGLSGWIAYNLFVERQPSAEGRNPVPAIVFAAVLLWLGITRIRGFLRGGQAGS